MPEADYAQIEWLIGQVDTATTTLNDGSTAVHHAPFLTVSNFGDTDGAQPCQSSYLAMAERGAAAAGLLVDVLTSDSDRLHQVLAAYQDTDGTVSTNMHLAAPTLDVFSAHVHSGNGPADDYIRGGHIDRLVEAADGVTGPAVVDLDANVSLDAEERGDHDGLAIGALRRFGNELGFEDAGDVGPTSQDGEGERLDYVFTSPGIETDDAVPVQGGPSDHDGQYVDIELPRW